MDIASDLEEKHHLPENRQMETKFPAPPPWEVIQMPHIKTTLLDPTANKRTNPTILKTSALETIDSYPVSATHAYTDGSAFKGTKFAGYGVYLKYPDGDTYEACDPCGKDCSNYDAELHAIRAAVETIHQQTDLQERQPEEVVTFSDSSSALDALKHPPYKTTELSHTALAIHNLMLAHEVQVTLQWIPATQ